jgi:hypothetical protein
MPDDSDLLEGHAMSPDTIVCMYSCQACGLVDVRVPVRLRYRGEGVSHWVKHAVTPALAADHKAKRQGTCQPMALQEVKIPLTGRERVGGPVVQ